MDAYSLFWFVIFLIVGSLSRLYLPMTVPAVIILLYVLFRIFSRNTENRQVENARFLAAVHAVFRRFRAGSRTVMKTDKEYYYFKCPNCGQPMRVPKGLGKVQINCRACSSSFETKS